MIKPNKPFHYALDSTACEPELIKAMVKQRKHIMWGSFTKYCDSHAWAMDQGYSDVKKGGVGRLCHDLMVWFYVSKYDGQKCYYIERSGIKYVWLKGVNENI